MHELQLVKPKKNTVMPKALAAAALSLFLTNMAHADDITYPSIDFSTIPFAAWVAAAIGFSVMAGMAFIGLSAITSVLRKSRGAVR